MERNKLLKLVKQTILKIEPGAEIILYGSRSREDNKNDSDWDFVILVDGKIDSERIDTIRHQIYEVEWDSGEVLSSIIRTRNDWGSPYFQAMPFYKNVVSEGIHI